MSAIDRVFGSEPDPTRPPRVPILPQNLEAEMGVLGTMIFDSSKTAEISQRVELSDFTLPKHRTIFAAVTRLVNAGRPVDLVIVTGELRTAGEIDAVGGSEYLAKLVEQLPNADHGLEYASDVRRASILRLALQRHEQLGAALRTGEVNGEFHHLAESIAELQDEAGEKKTEPRIEIITASDSIAQPRPDREMILGKFPKGRLGLFDGKWRSGKGSHAINFAVAASLGRALGAGFECVRPYRSGFLTQEDWRDRVDDRSEESALGFGVDPKKDLTNLLLIHRRSPPHRFDDPAYVDRLINALAHWKPELLFLDNLSKLHGLDENSAKDMALVFSQIERLVHELEVAVIILHHLGKDESRGSRGSSAIPGFCDYRITATREQGSRVSTLKCRDGKDTEDWEATFEKFQTENGGVQFKLVTTAFEGPTAADLRNLDEFHALLKARGADGVPIEVLIDAGKWKSRNTLLKKLRDLQAGGRADSRMEGKTKLWFAIEREPGEEG
jgi:hypothetical protein